MVVVLSNKLELHLTRCNSNLFVFTYLPVMSQPVILDMRLDRKIRFSVRGYDDRFLVDGPFRIH